MAAAPLLRRIMPRPAQVCTASGYICLHGCPVSYLSG